MSAIENYTCDGQMSLIENGVPIINDCIRTIELKTNVDVDEGTLEISKKFDYEFTGETVTKIKVPTFPKDFSIGLVVGSSGSGKSTILKECFGEEEKISWDNSKAIISNFDTIEDGVRLLSSVGLGSIPSWCKPYKVLSNGEKFRADLARRLHDGAVIDEFTSVVNREAAKSCSNAVQKYIRANGIKNVVFASCHDDIIEYLRPDWVYNTDTSQFYNGRYLWRKPIELLLHECVSDQWEMFKKHHYLSGELNKASACYVAEINGLPVAFVSVMTFPGNIKKAMREHRLVVLPDFQGIGIGNAVSETVAQYYVDRGYRYFSKTANPRCGEHRDKSNLWRPTTYNHKDRIGYEKQKQNGYQMSVDKLIKHSLRVCYCHEYIGEE